MLSAGLSHPRRTEPPPMSFYPGDAERATDDAHVDANLRAGRANATVDALRALLEAPASERITCGTARETSHAWIRPLLAEANRLRREFGGEVVVTLARNPLSGAYTAATFALEMTPELAARYREEAEEMARERADAAALLDRHRENAGLTYEDVSETEAA